MVLATANRDAEHEAFNTWMAEAVMSVAALNDCTELLAGLGEGSTLI
jgi:hypothetical protein